MNLLIRIVRWYVEITGCDSHRDLAKFEPVMGRGEPATILVPGVGGRWVARGKTVKHYFPTNHHPEQVGRHLHQPEPDLVVVGLCVILGCC